MYQTTVRFHNRMAALLPALKHPFSIAPADDSWEEFCEGELLLWVDPEDSELLRGFILAMGTDT